MKRDELGKSGKRYVRTSPPIWDQEITDTKMSYSPIITPMTCASIIREGDPIPVIEWERMELFEATETEKEPREPEDAA